MAAGVVSAYHPAMLYLRLTIQGGLNRTAVARGMCATTTMTFAEPDEARRAFETFKSELISGDRPHHIRGEISRSDGITVWEWEAPDG